MCVCTVIITTLRMKELAQRLASRSSTSRWWGLKPGPSLLTPLLYHPAREGAHSPSLEAWTPVGGRGHVNYVALRKSLAI